MKTCQKGLHQYHGRRCIECRKIYNAAYAKANPEIFRASSLSWYRANREREMARSVAWRKANPEKHRALSAAWDKANPEKQKARWTTWRKANPDKNRNKAAAWRKINPEKNKDLNLAWRKANPERMTALRAKRRASKLLRTPPWLTKQHFEEIRQFYVEAKDLQWLSDPTDPLEVDHMVPLQGDNVSGLHVPWNLQILPKSLNCSKKNRFKGL
jgi:hypothetical protein